RAARTRPPAAAHDRAADLAADPDTKRRCPASGSLLRHRLGPREPSPMHPKKVELVILVNVYEPLGHLLVRLAEDLEAEQRRSRGSLYRASRQDSNRRSCLTRDAIFGSGTSRTGSPRTQGPRGSVCSSVCARTVCDSYRAWTPSGSLNL